jgi:hypothetical protein
MLLVTHWLLNPPPRRCWLLVACFASLLAVSVSVLLVLIHSCHDWCCTLHCPLLALPLSGGLNNGRQQGLHHWTHDQPQVP